MKNIWKYEIRNAIFDAMKEKRKSRSYKSTDKVYKAAMKRAKKEKKKLANVVEFLVDMYASGATGISFFTQIQD